MTQNTVTFTVINNCSHQTIWPAVGGNLEVNGQAIRDPLPPGLALEPFQSFATPPFPLPWSGRIWARQHCNSDGTNCRIGDCGTSSCWGKSAKPVTLFEVTAKEGAVWYDISLGKLQCSRDVKRSSNNY